MEYKFHPICLEYSDMDRDAFEAMKADIKQYGQKLAIILYEEMILDGKNRYKACMELGIEPKFKTYEGKDPRGLAESLNDHRRHYTETEKMEKILKLKEKYAQEAKKNMGPLIAKGPPRGGPLIQEASKMASEEALKKYGYKISPSSDRSVR